MPVKSTFGNGSTLALSLLFLLAAVLACSSGSAKKCTSTVTLDGGTFVGEDVAEEKATRNACNKYCREADPGYQAIYGEWLDSPAGKAAGRPAVEGRSDLQGQGFDGLRDRDLRQ